MELALVSDILDRLKQCPGKQLETQSLEFKSWCKTEKDLSYEITEAAVCLSNTAGGLVIVGVDDKKTIPAAIEACPHPFLTVDSIKKWIWDLTKPPVNCNVVRLSVIFANLKGTPPGDLFIVEVRKTTHASGHRTNRGVSLIRIDTECRPEYFTEKDDYSGLFLNNLTFNDLSQSALSAAIQHRETRYLDVARAGLQPIDHLVGADLVRLQDQPGIAGQPVAVPTVAAFLFFGQEDKLKQNVPSGELFLSFKHRQSLR